jgi:hypothetical protein
MKRILMTLVVGLWLSTVSAPAYSAGPSWMGDATGSFLYNDKNATGTAALNQFRYSYHLGVWGDYDWVDYLVELGSGASVNDSRVTLLNGAGTVPVALSRAKMTMHIMDVLFIDFGRFDNPVAVDGWDFLWDNDFKTTGLGQRVEVGNFFLNAVQHFHGLSTGNADIAVGSSTGAGAAILFGGNLGYTFELSDGFSLLASGDAFKMSGNTQVGANFLMNFDNSEGYPIIMGLGGYIPIQDTDNAGTTLSGLFKLQYGDLSIDDGYMIAMSVGYWGDDSYINAAGTVTGGDSLSVFANERLTRTSGVLLPGVAAAAKATVINVGIDVWYRFHSWFKMGIEADYGTSSSTGLTNTSFMHAELVAATEF